MKIKKIALVFFLILITSCSSDGKNDIGLMGYRETFIGYFVGKYTNDAVFIGKKYHYVFEDDAGQISEFTKSEWKSKLNISNINLMVNKDNRVYGEVELEFIKTVNQLPASDINFAIAKGFSKNNNRLNKTLSLKGIRYKPAKEFSINDDNKFSTKYEFLIHYDFSNPNNMSKTALTPITQAADGILMLAKDVLIPALGSAVSKDSIKQFRENFWIRE